MPRLFVALDLPEKHYAAFEHTQKPVGGVRWVPLQQLHLTLQFLGNVSEEVIPPLKHALARVSGRPITLSADRFDIFPSLRKARVLVIRFAPCEALDELQRQVVSATQSAGLSADRQSFKSHVTVARLRSVSLETVHFLLERPIPVTTPIRFETFYLYQSHLDRKGARHERLATFAVEQAG